MEDRLAEIKARFDAIIPGPWRWFGNTATSQVYLGTVNRGRLYIMYPGTASTERVFDHDAMEGYSLEEARDQQRILSWCPVHGDPEFPGDPTDRQVHCRCDEIREFLSGEMDQEEGRRDLLRGIHTWLTRHVVVEPDLRFPVRDLRYGEDEEDRKHQGGLMFSYREGMPRYEVLGETIDGSFRGYRTREEYEAQTGKKAETALYREDFVGLDQPEATFIERAPEDIEYLLKRLALAEVALDSTRLYASWAMRGQQFQGTVEAQARAAHDVLAWEAVQG